MTRTDGVTMAGVLPASPSGSAAFGASAARSLFLATTFLFVLSTLFDPSDRIFGLKLPLYIVSWGTGVFVILMRRGRVRIPIQLIVYSLSMVTIPLFSIWYYYLVDGSDPFEGFQLLKAYAFISMAMLMYLTGTNLLKHLSIALTLLALSIVFVAALVFIEPALYLPVYAFGNEYGIFSIDNRDYGSGLVLFQMYFVTSPMLAISAAYYFDRAHRSLQRRKLYGVLAALNIGAMFLAGTRNNIMAAILLPLALAFLYSKRRELIAVPIAMVSVVGIFVLWEQISVLLDPMEVSNRTKLTLLGDYATGFDKLPNLIFGTGLGAYQHWTGRGYYYVTELTYLEVIRNFGLLLGGVMILLLLYPIAYAFVLRRSYKEKHIIVGYALYLLMCATNPNLFSSMGMLILSVIVANISLYQANAADRWRVQRE